MLINYKNIDELIEAHLNGLQSVHVTRIVNKRIHLFQELLQRTSEIGIIIKHGEVGKGIYHLIHGAKTPECQCGEKCSFEGLQKGYNKSCGNKKCKYKEIRKSIKKFNLENYGVENCMQRPEIRKKQEETMLKTYGAKFTLQVPELYAKAVDTWKFKYDTDHPMQNEDVKKKVVETNIERYGFKCSFSNNEVQEKYKLNFLKNHGVENPYQLETVKINAYKAFIKWWNSADRANYFDSSNSKWFKRKNYIFPSGKEILVQGCENLALDQLLQTYTETDIICKKY